MTFRGVGKITFFSLAKTAIVFENKEEVVHKKLKLDTERSLANNLDILYK